MRYDENSTNPKVYVDSNVVRVGQGPTAWQAATLTAHQETQGPAAFGINYNPYAASEVEPTPTPVGVTYVKCESTDEGALLVIADGVEPVGKQINIGTVTATGLADVEVGDYVKAETI